VIVCTLGVLLPVAFAAGIVARKAVPVAATVPPGLAGQVDDFSKVLWTKTNIWPGQHIVTSLLQNAAGSVAVELMLRDLVKPDVLVYWVAGKESAAEGLPENARLLGALSNASPFPIPPDVRGEVGYFILYSLADQEVVAVSAAFQTAIPH
jgi:hypothetical protein